MSYFLSKTEPVCLAEIDAAADFVQKTFRSEINFDRLADQIDQIVSDKISDYYYQRFKDWTVADLITLSQIVRRKAEEQRPIRKVDGRSRKPFTDKETQVI